MKKQLLTLAIAISAATALGFASIPLTTANAIASGDIVEFLISTDQIQPTGPSNSNGVEDRLIFTGRPASTIDITGCGSGTRPVQQAVLRDVSEQSGVVNVIISSLFDAIPARTQLGNINPVGICTIVSEGSTYIRYQGTVSSTP